MGNWRTSALLSATSPWDFTTHCSAVCDVSLIIETASTGGSSNVREIRATYYHTNVVVNFTSARVNNAVLPTSEPCSAILFSAAGESEKNSDN